MPLYKKPDIVLLNEMHLLLVSNPKIPNYFSYRNDLTPKEISITHGGTAILVHRHILHKHVILNTSMQSISILIKVNNIKVLIFTVYKPPNSVLLFNELDILTTSSN